MDLPTYSKSNNEDNYNEELNQTLRDNLSDNGWIVPSLTTTQIRFVADDLEPMTMPIGALWYNTTVNKLWVKTGIDSMTGLSIIEEITSTVV